MAFFHTSVDKEAVKAFILEDLKNLGLKVPKLEKIDKAIRSSTQVVLTLLLMLCTRLCSYHDERLNLQIPGDGAVFGVQIALVPSVEDGNIGRIPK